MTARDRAFGTLASQLFSAAHKPAAERNSIDRLILDPIAKGVPGLDVRTHLASARALLTIEGASALTLGIIDPNWLIERSGILDTKAGPALFSSAATSGGDMRLTALQVILDDLAYRLVAASRQGPDILTLTFEDAAVAALRSHTKHRAWSRGKVTRAEAIGQMVAEVKHPLIPYFSPDGSRRQPKAQPKYPDTAPVKGETGFDKGTTFTVKGDKADHAQMRNATIVMGVADQENLPNPGRVRKSMLVAAIGESSIRAKRNEGNPPSRYWGVFQGSMDLWDINDTEGQARSFLKGGKGFQAGGAIVLARENPGMQPGEIAWHVEGNRSNFGSDLAATDFYAKWGKEADAIMAAWRGGGSDTSDTVTRIKSYQFTRGLPGKVESSWDAATRLAQEVNWRFFAAGGVAAFVSDDYLITQQAQAILQSPTGGPLLAWPDYSWDRGRQAAQVQLQVHAGRWTAAPGMVLLLRENDENVNEWGPLLGYWIVMSVDQNLLDPTDCMVTLIKPMQPRIEPAAEVVSQQKKKAPTDTTGADARRVRRLTGGYSALVSTGLTFAGPDQGIDFTGKGTIYAPVAIRITRVDRNSGWPGGTLIAAQILDRRIPGAHGIEYMYFAEDIKPGNNTVVGAELPAGAIVATMNSSYPGTEIGFAKDAHGTAFGTIHDGKPGGPAPAWGSAFGDWIRSLSGS